MSQKSIIEEFIQINEMSLEDDEAHRVSGVRRDDIVPPTNAVQVLEFSNRANEGSGQLIMAWQLPDQALLVLDAEYADWDDESSDGWGTLTLSDCTDNAGDAPGTCVHNVLAKQRQAIVEATLAPLKQHWVSAFGSSDAAVLYLVDAIKDCIPKAERIAGLRQLEAEAASAAMMCRMKWIADHAPAINQIHIDREVDTSGEIILVTENAPPMHFTPEDIWQDAARYGHVWSDFSETCEVNTDIAGSMNDGDEAAFLAWISARTGAKDWPSLWSAIVDLAASADNQEIFAL